MNFRTKRWITPGILTLACLGLLNGCASTQPSHKMPEPPPALIQVAGATLPAVIFDNLVTDMPGGRIIGYHYEGIQYTRTQDYQWDEHFSNETKVLSSNGQDILEDAGYRVTPNDTEALHLAATMARVSFNSFARKVSFDQAECEITWELLRADEDTPFFSHKTLGAGRVDPGKPGAIIAAFELALRRLLATPEFAAAVTESAGS